MKKLMIVGLASFLSACTSQGISSSSSQTTAPPESAAEEACIGTTALPDVYIGKFVPVVDEDLLSRALGAPTEGKLCQGQVYEAVGDEETQGVTVYRAWNSTNPSSQLGQWWASSEPAGLSAQYRAAYEICYQWSPLDKMSTCTLRPGTKVVIGNGQSARCSQYLTYPVSAEQQIYIENASESVLDCESYDAVFSWQPIQ